MSHSVDVKYLALLRELQLDVLAHLNGSALAHLQGVYALLSEWGNEEAVCLAGLFHNIYGTEMFKPKSVPLDQRARIAAVIGAEAEELAYLFCVCKRIGFFDQHRDPAHPVLWDEVHRRAVETSVPRLRALMEIEVANGVDQFRPGVVGPAQIAQIAGMAAWMLERGRGNISCAAERRLQYTLERLRAPAN